MLRFLGALLLIIVVLAAIAGGLFYWKKSDLAARFLAQSLQTTVCLDDFQIGFTSMGITNLTIVNPNGNESKVPDLLAVSSVEIEASPLSLLRQEIEIPEITIETAILGVVLYNRLGTDNSWSRMLNSPTTKIQTSPDRSTNGRSVVVQKLIVKNLYLNIYSATDEKAIEFPAFQQIEVDNIGAGGGIPSEVIVEVLLNEVMRYVLNNIDVADLLLKAIGGKGKPAFEIPALVIQSAVKQILGSDLPPAQLPDIPKGKHCYTP